MKKITLTFLLLISAFFSLAEGSCTVSIQKNIASNDKGTFAQLVYTVHESGTDCSHCSESGVWYFKEGGNFNRIVGAPNNYYNTYKPGTYKVEVCGAYAIIVLDSGEVFEKKVVTDPANNSFSVYPNPCSDGKINLLVPDSPVSSETDKFKVEIYNVLGNQVFIKENLEFGTKNLPIDLSNQGKGIFILKISSGTEVKVLKVLVN
ncbi:MAG: T9SS type A sorting domain-containing protein [Flavobacteriales bacterium]